VQYLMTVSLNVSPALGRLQYRTYLYEQHSGKMFTKNARISFTPGGGKDDVLVGKISKYLQSALVPDGTKVAALANMQPSLKGADESSLNADQKAIASLTGGTMATLSWSDNNDLVSGLEHALGAMDSALLDLDGKYRVEFSAYRFNRFKVLNSMHEAENLPSSVVTDLEANALWRRSEKFTSESDLLRQLEEKHPVLRLEKLPVISEKLGVDYLLFGSYVGSFARSALSIKVFLYDVNSHSVSSSLASYKGYTSLSVENQKLSIEMSEVFRTLLLGQK
ncbi:MAG: hypothetical protein AAF387_22790, partial [Pseudomonadota bacterium]